MMRVLLFVAILGVMGGCAAEQGEGQKMIALVIANEMDRHVLSSQIDFTPESDTHIFGFIRGNNGNAGNLGFSVNAYPTAMKVALSIAKHPGINPMEVDADTEREEVVQKIELFEPKRNEANYPEYHLVIRPDGTIEQVRDVHEDWKRQSNVEE